MAETHYARTLDSLSTAVAAIEAKLGITQAAAQAHLDSPTVPPPAPVSEKGA